MTRLARLRQLAAGATGSLILAGTGLIALPVGAQAATVSPAWQPDANDRGAVAFYNSAGHVITTGSITDAPMAAYFVVPGGITADHGYAASTTPVEGSNSAGWSGTQQMTTTQTFPTPSLPGDLAGYTGPVVPGGAGRSLKTRQIDTFPNTSTTAGYQNLYEIRVYTSPASSTPAPTDSWYAADVLVDTTAGTWTQVYPNTVTVPGAPSGLTATGGNTKALLSWSAPTSTGGAAITGYHVTATPAAGSSVIADTPTPATSYTLNGLTNGTAYTVSVAATNSAGTGPASSEASVTPTVTVPGVPTDVAAVAQDGSAIVSFTAPADSGDGTTLSYTVTASTGQSVTGSTSPLTVAGLANGTSRTFTVTAANGVGAGGPSAASNPVAYFTTALTLAAIPASVNAGSVLTQHGALTGGAVAGRPVTLVIDTAGHGTRRVALTTDSTGGFRYALKVDYTTTVKAQYAATSTQRAATSNLRTTIVNAVVRITAPVTGTKTRVRTLAVTGTSTPNKAGSVVALYERRGTTYVLLARTTVARNGSFRFLRTFSKATHVLQVRIGATPTNGPGRSKLVTLYEI